MYELNAVRCRNRQWEHQSTLNILTNRFQFPTIVQVRRDSTVLLLLVISIMQFGELYNINIQYKYLVYTKITNWGNIINNNEYCVNEQKLQLKVLVSSTSVILFPCRQLVLTNQCRYCSTATWSLKNNNSWNGIILIKMSIDVRSFYIVL